MTPSIFELICPAMNYDWGVKGNASLVAQLLAKQTINPERPYAELWMGIHPKGPARIKYGNGNLLSKVLEDQPSLLGEYTKNKWGTLPFLFKVLSIAKPLSIQMHPHKEWAEELHKQDPQNYPDDNHKPEIALAISDLESLYGFVNSSELESIIARYPILQDYYQKLIHSSTTEVPDFKDFIPQLLSLSGKDSKKLLKQLWSQIQQELSPNEKENLFLSLYPKFPQDLGLLFIFFMQYVTVPKESSLYLKANTLHAYLSGNVVECMANSDNVIRAGITDKFKDVDKMLTQLKYNDVAPILNFGENDSQYVKKYSTDAKEFEVHSIKIPNNQLLKNQIINTPSILLTLSGEGKLVSSETKFNLKKGSVLFIGSGQLYSIHATKSLSMFLAIVPLVR